MKCRDIPGSMSHIQSLPNELLAGIFESGTSLCTGHPELRLPFQHLVSSVSRKWRAVVLSSPGLWTTIVFDCLWSPQFKCASLWIERSGACLLDITIFINPISSDSAKSAMDRVIPHTHRWRQFRVVTFPQSMFETIAAPLHSAAAPHL